MQLIPKEQPSLKLKIARGVLWSGAEGALDRGTDDRHLYRSRPRHSPQRITALLPLQCPYYYSCERLFARRRS